MVAAVSRTALFLLVLALFAVWSNSFVAIGFLLGSEQSAARLDWVELVVARFLPALPVCAVYCFGFRRRETLRVLRRHWRRLILCGLLAVPCYNLALYYGQQHGVPAPVASVTTALLPLYVLVLAALLLGEKLTRRRVVGFLIALGGIAVIALSRRASDAPGGYGMAVAVTALAPLSWSLFSIASKPVAGEVQALVWTFLAILTGSLPLVVAAPFVGGRELVALDAAGWGAVLYLSLLCTVGGYAVWTWLLRHLPASTVGLTVFLNPPFTTISKITLSLLAPAVFVFRVSPAEWLGGGLCLLGLAVALVGRPWRRRKRPPPLPAG